MFFTPSSPAVPTLGILRHAAQAAQGKATNGGGLAAPGKQKIASEIPRGKAKRIQENLLK